MTSFAVSLCTLALGAALAASASIPADSATHASAAAPRSHDPAAAAAELLAADRALGQAAATLDFRAAMTSWFAADVVIPVPGTSSFADGREAALATLASDTANARSRIEWTPVRAGVSADLTHGVTIGRLSITRPTGNRLDYKYLAYWTKGAEGWRVRVWRRIPRPARALPPDGAAPDAPWLPRVPAMALQGAAFEDARLALQQMERIFSDSAARIGIGPAFEALGADDAMHLSAPPDVDFMRGNRAIARAVQGDAPAGSSPVVWSAERAILAPSGDFGVTLGYILPTQAAPDGSRRPFPFFTIWRREPGGWKYIAE